MKNINTKQIVMSLGIVALSVLSLSAHAGNRDRDDNHSAKRSFSNDGHGQHSQGREHRNHRYGHPRYNQHRRVKHHYYYNDYSRNGYGYGHNQHRQENHRGHYQQEHRIHLLPRISGQLHLPGIRLNLHL